MNENGDDNDCELFNDGLEPDENGDDVLPNEVGVLEEV
jgi:hypothetical protein